MVLREAGAADVDALCDAWYAMLDETGMLARPVALDWRALLFEHFAGGMSGGHHAWRVIEVDGRIVATGGLFVHVEPSAIALHGRGATLAGVYTYAPHRRRGYARSIVGELIALARDRGCAGIRLRATPMGRPLYEQLGFRAADEMFLSLA